MVTSYKNQKGIRTGSRFHRLTVIKKLDGNQYQFQCECGNFIVCAWKSYSSCGQCGYSARGHKTEYSTIIKNHISDAPFWIKKSYASMRSMAHRRAIPFSITIEQAALLYAKPFHYCGALPAGIRRSGDFIVQLKQNGIDRVNSSLGYIVENCVSACKTCNIAKSTMSTNEFLAWIERVHTHIQAILGSNSGLRTGGSL